MSNVINYLFAVICFRFDFSNRICVIVHKLFFRNSTTYRLNKKILIVSKQQLRKCINFRHFSWFPCACIRTSRFAHAYRGTNKVRTLTEPVKRWEVHGITTSSLWQCESSVPHCFSLIKNSRLVIPFSCARAFRLCRLDLAFYQRIACTKYFRARIH